MNSSSELIQINYMFIYIYFVLFVNKRICYVNTSGITKQNGKDLNLIGNRLKYIMKERKKDTTLLVSL